jgi:predicted ATPase/tetratricopeptide (TPR) repeat protein
MARTLYRDRYEPLALAGRGAQGEVWKARDQVHDRIVALKIRNVVDGERDALLSEARTLLRMRPHEGLPLVRDDFFATDPLHGDRYVIVMDWIDGPDLGTTMPLAFEDVIRHLDAVARALDHLHAHEPAIVHRDVKPSNIVVTPEGRTVLVDFGLAGSTVTPYLAGTPAFLAPEVASGDGAVPASDVFSLAVTALVLLSGEAPEPGREPALPSVPEQWREGVMRALQDALSVDPSMRPRRATELVASLRPPSTPNNLPAELSSFVGREAATSELRHLLTTSRLVSLVGPGGSGKTRLALRVAHTALPTFAGGVWIAELAGVVEPALVPARVAVALGVGSHGSGDLVDAVAEFLGTDEQLLVLDNCEHVVDACAHLVEALLRACPRLTILATSREALRASGETVWTVAPLAANDAVALFNERAPHGASVASDDALVQEVCVRLDGIPLAVELAAAQLGSMPLQQLAGGLDEVLGVLTGGARTNPRQETMRATIDWSHELLSAEEQIALRRLSVFAGGFTRDAAEAVADAVISLPRLVETSLLNAEDERFRLLEPVRQFAADKLEESGESDDYTGKHSRWVLSLTDRDDVITPGWAERLGADHDNIEAALSHTISTDPATAGEIVRRAVLYWTHRGFWVQGRNWVRRTLTSDALDAKTRAELLNRAGDMARNQGDLEEGRRLLEESVSIYRELGDERGLGGALLGLGLTAHAMGDMEASKSHQLESIAINRRLGNRRVIAMALNNLALVHDSLGELTDAIRVLDEALAIYREDDSQLLAAFTLLNLGSMRRKSGDASAARTQYEEALAITSEAGHQYGRAIALNELAAMDLSDGDLSSARATAEESLEISRGQNDKSSQAHSVHVLGGVARGEGDRDLASALHGQALALRREIGAPLDVATSLGLAGVVDVDRGDADVGVQRFGEATALREAAGVPEPDEPDVSASIAEARRLLGEERFAHHWELGRRAAMAPRTGSG